MRKIIISLTGNFTNPILIIFVRGDENSLAALTIKPLRYYADFSFMSAHTPKGKVLIVEDDPEIRAGIAAILHGQGFEPIPCGSGNEAFTKLHSEKVSLILLDIMLPDMSGLDILKTIRQNSALEGIPVIMITGEDTDSDIMRGYSDGADYYITKPFNEQQLQYGVKLFVP